MNRYDEGGLDALLDKRLSQASHRRAPVDEALRMVEHYRSRQKGCNARHFYAWYRKENGNRSYTWVKSRLQEAGLIERAKKRGKHRKNFVPWIGGQLADILCERHERVVGHDNCVSFEGLKLQIPTDRHRCHYVKAKVIVYCAIQTDKWLSCTAQGSLPPIMRLARK